MAVSKGWSPIPKPQLCAFKAPAVNCGGQNPLKRDLSQLRVQRLGTRSEQGEEDSDCPGRKANGDTMCQALLRALSVN